MILLMPHHNFPQNSYTLPYLQIKRLTCTVLLGMYRLKRERLHYSLEFVRNNNNLGTWLMLQISAWLNLVDRRRPGNSGF